jgi:hypothetical protein
MKSHRNTIAVWGLVCTLLFAAPALQALWITDGTPICTAPGGQRSLEIITDGAGGAIITWADPRDGVDYHIYAERVNEQGLPMWTTDGVAVCTVSGAQGGPKLVPDGAGGAIITWYDIRDGVGDWDIYAQRLDGNGNLMWPDTGVVICDTTDRSGENPEMVSDGSGGAIIVWVDKRGPATELYVQRVDSNGNTLWARNGIAITPEPDYQQVHQIIPDGAGGAFIAWEDTRNAFTDIYAQRVNADGDTLWTAGGVPICRAYEQQRGPELTADGAGGAIIVWEDNRIPTERRIYAQRVNADGDTLWPADGKLICDAPLAQSQPAIVNDGAGGAIVVWRLHGGSVSDVHAQRIDADGDSLWTSGGVAVCSADEDQNSISVIPDGSGGAIAVWQDDRNSDTGDIFAQRMSASGSPLWTLDGVGICTAPLWQRYPRLLSDGNGGAVFVWEDARDNEYDVYGSLADATGQLVPTLLKTYEVSCREGAIFVRWSVSSSQAEDRFTAYRREAASTSSWNRIAVAIEGKDGEFEFSDETCVPGSSYRYRVDVTDETGQRTLFETDAATVPKASLALYQNAPNPFHPTTAVRYYLPDVSVITISVYDIAGKLVKQLVDGEKQPAGIHEVEWNGKDDGGGVVSSGVYFCRMQAGTLTLSRKMILVR